jgi:hypothetical protein
MSIAITLSEFLNESVKSDKTIYHFTESLDSLFSILEDNALIAGSHERNSRYGLGYDNVSFTRNPKLWDIEYLGDTKSRWNVRIAFDYDRMSKKWNFKPFDYGISEEMEEIVETDEMTGITEYITEISVSSKESKSELEYLKELYPGLKIKSVRRK